ncbi:hypothetical protein FJZ48_02595 [Candidatus Uhrbacteria bacterium]|nr:hypothetical protein [Candidatus Uhrbacteria bacterium]
MLNPVRLTIQSIKPDSVVAKTSDGQLWTIPLHAIHGSVKVGQELRCIGVGVGSEDAGQTAFAQSLLNELLGKNS